MGAFYGSVTGGGCRDGPSARRVRGENKAGEVSCGALARWLGRRLPRRRRARPTHRRGAGEAPRRGRRLVSLHDNDVFAYSAWKDGKLLDEYNSCPDYFGAATPSVRKRTAGNPSAFADLLPAGVTPDLVKRDLSGDDTTQLEAFARHLGLPSVLTSYDYLMGGETDDVPEFSRFVHVPDRSAELASRRRKEAAAAEELERLRVAGVLLCDIAVSEPDPMTLIPTMASGIGAGEFLYAVSDLRPGSGGDLFRLAPPYSAGPVPTRIRLKSGVQDLCVGPSGQYLAVGRAADGWSTELWDLSAQTLIRESRQARAIKFVGFSPNEEQLLSFSEGTLVIHDIPQGISRAMRCPSDGRTACIHPGDNILVATDGQIAIVLSDAATGREIKRLVPPPPSQQDREAAVDRLLAGMRAGAVPAEP